MLLPADARANARKRVRNLAMGPAVKVSLTARLTLLFCAASSAVLILFGYLVGASVDRHFERQDSEKLSGKLELAKHALLQVQTRGQLAALPQQLAESLIGHHGIEMMVLSPEQTVLFVTSGAQFPSSLTTARGAADTTQARWITSDGHTHSGIASSATLGIPGTGAALVAVGTDMFEHEQFMRSFKTTLWLVILGAALLTSLFGWLAARRGLAPLRGMRRELDAITALRLDARLSETSVPPELEQLVSTLNNMLERLEESFLHLSNFSLDLAHELRAPVSNLLTQTQVTLSKARTAGEYEEILSSNAEEFERLSRIISDMLFLAKSDNNLVIPSSEPIDLMEEVDGVVEFFEALADEKDIELSVIGWGAVTGDRLMIRRALTNLLSNAIRHTPPAGRIMVDIRPWPGSTLLSVANTGDLVPPEHLARLFDRFYRVDGGRARHSDGAGLGLAITRSIMHAHGGEALVTSADGMMTFTLLFPRG